jgi:PPM family protein phosphatase
MNCHQCGAIVAASDRFCEECGANLTAPTVAQTIGHGCQKCGADPSNIDADRYCIQCGFRQVESAQESLELQPAPNLAGASDRGRRHHQNEDAIALKILDPQTYLLVVCDGVSSSQHPELASQAAATACIAKIETAILQGRGYANDRGLNADAAMLQGISNAMTVVSNLAFDPQAEDGPPSTTIVAAIVCDNIVTIGWLGDSRAYWISPTKSIQLTEDDSWMREAVAAGEVTLAEAEKSPYAHAITRWLGADVADDDKPNLITFTIPGAGYLLLCSDGLWNYAPDPAYLYHLFQQAGDVDPLNISRHLIRYANQQGGQDNITVGILSINLPQPLSCRT